MATCPSESKSSKEEARFQHLMQRLDRMGEGIDRLVSVLAQQQTSKKDKNQCSNNECVDVQTIVELTQANLRQAMAMRTIDQEATGKQ